MSFLQTLSSTSLQCRLPRCPAPHRAQNPLSWGQTPAPSPAQAEDSTSTTPRAQPGLCPPQKCLHEPTTCRTSLELQPSTLGCQDRLVADAGPWSGRERTSAQETLGSASDCDLGHVPPALGLSFSCQVNGGLVSSP